jgi:hypothetical protein
LAIRNCCSCSSFTALRRVATCSNHTHMSIHGSGPEAIYSRYNSCGIKQHPDRLTQPARSAMLCTMAAAGYGTAAGCDVEWYQMCWAWCSTVWGVRSVEEKTILAQCPAHRLL